VIGGVSTGGEVPRGLAAEPHPSEQLGIVVLTNGEPTGAAEAVANGFWTPLRMAGHQSIGSRSS
jgi:hypothetical protein